MNSFQEKKKNKVETPSSSQELDIVMKGHPVMERPLNSMSDFRNSVQLLQHAQDFAKLAKEVGMLLDCGCHLPSESDKDYIRYNIPKSYVPLGRPYKMDCDVPNCLKRAIMQKYLDTHVIVKNINATEDFIPVVEKRIRECVAKKCSKINLCFLHFEENFIEDCPECAIKFGLVPPN